MAIVLASQSPRRQELLARIGVEDFKTLSLDIDESYPEGLSPEDTVRYIAKKKCDAAVALCSPDDLIITAPEIRCGGAAGRAGGYSHHGGHDGLFGQ